VDKEIISQSAEETVLIGEEFAKEFLRPGTVAVLRGELGAGKTQLAKGIARYFGLHEDEIASPTYSLVNEYPLSHDGIGRLYHLDCYRFENPEELLELGIEEYLYPKHAVTIVEWPERIEEYLPANRIEIHIETLSENIRKIVVKNNF
jgi:tRNA threonylcarbamoyladenosine biosynthesis protein TsaE